MHCIARYGSHKYKEKQQKETFPVKAIIAVFLISSPEAPSTGHWQRKILN